MDAIERLRERAQNEATCIELSRQNKLLRARVTRMEANANLIAAAPDLYAALERLYGRLLMSDRDGECRITTEEGEMAEFALKKARGEL